jgi:hypothetical protein
MFIDLIVAYSMVSFSAIAVLYKGKAKSIQQKQASESSTRKTLFVTLNHIFNQVLFRSY